MLLGASRGIGLGLVDEYLARGWRVIATARSLFMTPALAKRVAKADGALTVLSADINRPDDLATLSHQLKSVTLDLLFVVAGVSDDASQTIGQRANRNSQLIFAKQARPRSDPATAARLQVGLFSHLQNV